jgi:hypothetical protein
MIYFSNSMSYSDGCVHSTPLHPLIYQHRALLVLKKKNYFQQCAVTNIIICGFVFGKAINCVQLKWVVILVSMVVYDET